MTASLAFGPVDRLDGRVALIAGGLGAVGKATGTRLAALGARVVVLHRKSRGEAESFSQPSARSIRC